MAHYYDMTGKDVYEVEKANGKGMRPTTIRDARKLNLVPSVTTIISLLDKPGLLNYKMTHVVKASMKEAKKKEAESEEDYVSRLIFAANNASRLAAERGSYLHKILEGIYSGDIDITQLSQEEQDFVSPVIEEVTKIAPVFDLISEAGFCHVSGFGGKVDLSSPSGYVIDFKTKDTTDPKKFYKYDDHLMQLAAYRHGLNIPTARCLNIFISSVKPGIIEVHEWTEEELDKGWKMFKCLLDFWKISNNHLLEMRDE